ncbi:putative 6-oxopurine nucleoside phosphorylase [Alicyclobacillus contaminans]|uniref:S-methyl-5'-thioadenosine phosphorylase n=1 Tax=Alicyclobacillus contaminans TaxID=392016 RepID=UPI0004167934|nr:S-methyl-5'-thioadenosine phosphorylase [Alicyclobacillus contaminans]GMA48726.1 putative 6-oxopurine nucleoside phosphorylase [Alicyclobacillus contaminans]
MSVKFAIIGGTGVYRQDMLENAETTVLDTPYGQAQATLGTYRGNTVAFMPRHGTGHSIPPHRINYRANLWALKSLGVEQIFATAAVGSLQLDVAPGSLVLVDDFLDWTKQRTQTFFEDGQVVHVDMTDPYCNRLRSHLRNTAHELGLSLHDGGTYVCTDGPRFETRAEIRMYQSLGAAVVGMTTAPEVVLAKELEMCYATVAMVTNYCTGISRQALTVDEVVQTMNENAHQLQRLFFTALETIDAKRDCSCGHAVAGQMPLTGANASEQEGRH